MLGNIRIHICFKRVLLLSIFPEIEKEKRAFYYRSLLVTQENAEKFMNDYVNGTPEYDYTALWGDKWLGQVRAAE